MLDDLRRHEVDPNRRRVGHAQREAGGLHQRERVVGERLAVHLGAHAYLRKRIEIAHLNLQRLAEELVQLRQTHRPAGQEESRRRIAALLRTIEVDRTRNLRMEPRQHRADDLRDSVGHLVGILGDAAQRHVPALELQLLGLLQGAAERLRDVLGDRVAGDRNRAGVDLLVLDENEARRARADVQDHRAARRAGIRPAEGVVDGHRRNIDDLRRQPGGGHGIRDGTDLIELRGNDHRCLLALRRSTRKLVVADDFVDRERNVLFDFVAHKLLKLVRRHGRKLREAREHRLPVQRNDERGGLDALLAHDALQGRRERGLKRSERVAGRRKIGFAVGGERKRPLALQRIFGQHRLGRADIECQESGHLSPMDGVKVGRWAGGKVIHFSPFTFNHYCIVS